MQCNSCRRVFMRRHCCLSGASTRSARSDFQVSVDAGVDSTEVQRVGLRVLQGTCRNIVGSRIGRDCPCGWSSHRSDPSLRVKRVCYSFAASDKLYPIPFRTLLVYELSMPQGGQVVPLPIDPTAERPHRTPRSVTDRLLGSESVSHTLFCQNVPWPRGICFQFSTQAGD